MAVARRVQVLTIDEFLAQNREHIEFYANRPAPFAIHYWTSRMLRVNRVGVSPLELLASLERTRDGAWVFEPLRKTLETARDDAHAIFALVVFGHHYLSYQVIDLNPLISGLHYITSPAAFVSI